MTFLIDKLREYVAAAKQYVASSKRSNTNAAADKVLPMLGKKSLFEEEFRLTAELLHLINRADRCKVDLARADEAEYTPISEKHLDLLAPYGFELNRAKEYRPADFVDREDVAKLRAAGDLGESFAEAVGL